MNYKRYILIFIMLLLLPNLVSAYISQEDMSIFAVNASDEAMHATLYVDIDDAKIEDKGHIYSSIESIVGSMTQESIKNAVSVANSKVDEDIRKEYDLSFTIDSSAYSIDGPSAGGAISLLLISMLEDKPLPENVSMTGSINSDGIIGDVGGISSKAKKASEVGIDLFLIPKGNRTQVIDDDGEIKSVDFINYAYKEWDLKIIEVNDIDDVLEYAYKDIDSIDINSQAIETKQEFIPKKIDYSKSLNPMKDLLDNYLEDSKDKLKVAKSDLKDSDIKDTSVISNLLTVVNSSEEYINNAEVFSEKNYLYTSANFSFLAITNLTTVNEISKNPSILSVKSVAFDSMIEELEEKINNTKELSKNCSLDNFEWCIGAKQRISWAEIKLEKLKSNNYLSQIDSISKIHDYSYALSWINIANDFLEISKINSDYKFVESNYFKDLAKENIINLENELILSSTSIVNDEDFKRRVDSAKMNYNRGWYVTSLYDSALSLALLTSEQENQELVDQNFVDTKYNSLQDALRSPKNIDNISNIWSRLYLDHAMYYYMSYKDKVENNSQGYKTDLKTTNTILNFSYYLYEVEDVISNYYKNADIDIIVTDVTNNDSTKETSNKVEDSENLSQNQNVYVYSNDNNKNMLIYLILGVLVVVLLLIIYEIETLKKKHTKEQVQKNLYYLDEKLMEGRISPFTYKDMKRKYLEELKELKNNKSKLKVSDHHLDIDSKKTDTKTKKTTSKKGSKKKTKPKNTQKKS